MWFVYIIKCIDGSLYTGSTTNLEKRFKIHESGKGAKYTRSHKPETIVFFKKYAKKILALRKEREIKKLTRKEKLNFIEKQSKPG
jgi:putative endonuclease